MDNDDATVGQILTRRQVMTFGAASLAVLAGAKVKAEAPGIPLSEIDLVATPELTEGPFFVDKMLNREDLTGKSERVSVKDGLPLVLVVTVLTLRDGKGVPLKDAHLDLWHADTAGVYSGEPSSQIQHEDTKGETWLRGYQVTDAKGEAKFKTIFPGWYQGRTTHIHFKIRTNSSAGNVTREFTSQFFFDEKTNDAVLAKKPYSDSSRVTRNSRDGIYGARQADGTPVGSHLTLRTKEAGKGYESEFKVALILD